MQSVKPLFLLLAAILLILPKTALGGIVPCVMPTLTVFEILDPAGTRLGIVVIAVEDGPGYEAGNEHWRFSESALLAIDEQKSLEFAIWAGGDWEDPFVVEALNWQPEGTAIEWVHPTTVEWAPQNEKRAPAMGHGTYFGDPTLGGLRIHYSPRGRSTLTWIKLTGGEYMMFESEPVLERQEDVPETGSWWQGSIDP